MERILPESRSMAGLLVLLLALNILAWSIIAYSGGERASERQTWAHERTNLLDQQAALQAEIDGINQERALDADQAARLRNDLEQREGVIADLQAELGQFESATDNLDSLRLQLTSEFHSGEAKKAALENDLQAYRDMINQARSELSGRNATLAAREREIAKAAEQLSVLSETGDYLAAVEERKAEASAELDGYVRRINQARSELSGRNATLAAREREIAKAAEQLSLLGEAGDYLAAIEERKAEASAELDGYVRRINQARSELSGRNATLAAREREIAKTAEQLSLLGEAGNYLVAIEGRKAEVSAELDDYVRRTNLAKSALSGRNATLAAREREIAKAAEQLALLNGDIEKAEAERDELNRMLLSHRQDADNTLAQIEGQLAGMQNEQATRLAVLGSLAGKIDRRRAEVEQADAELGERQAALTEIDGRLTALNAEIEQSSQQLSDLEQAIATRQSERDDVQTMLAGLHQAREDEELVVATLDQKREELEALSAAVMTREGDLTSLTERLADADAALQQAESVLDDKRSEAAAIDQDVEAAEKRLAEISDEASDFERQISEAEERLVAGDQEIADRQKQIELLRRDEEKVRIMVAGLQARLAEQKQVNLDLDALRAEAEAARGERDQQMQLLAEERDRLEEIEAERLEKVASLADVSQQQAAKLGLLGSLDAKLDRQRVLVDDYAETEARLADVTSDLEAATVELGSRKDAVQEAEQRLQALTDEIEQASGSLGELDAERNAAEASLASAEAELVARQQAIQEAEARVASLKAEADEAEARLGEQESALTALNQDQATRLALLGSLDAKLESQRALLEEYDDTEARLAVLRSDVEDATGLLNEREEALRNAEFRLEQLRAEIDAKQAERDTAASRLQALTADVEKAEAELKSQQTTLAENKDELDRMAAERRDLLEAIEQARGDVEALEASDGVDPLLRASPVRTEDGIRIAHLLFNNASSELSPGARRKVEEAATWIKDNRIEKVRLIGYADATGSSASNKTLSQARAAQTARSLTERGVDPAIIEIEAVGDNVLIESTGQQVAEPLNRSVGIFIAE